MSLVSTSRSAACRWLNVPRRESCPLNPGVRHSVFWDAVLTGEPYPVKALLLVGTNPLLTSSNPLRGEEALRKLEFSAAIDMFMTPTTQLADLVLPAASWLEQDDVADLHFIWCVAARQKVAEIEAEAQRVVSGYYKEFDQHPELRIFLDKLRTVAEALRERTTLILSTSEAPWDVFNEESRQGEFQGTAALDRN